MRHAWGRLVATMRRARTLRALVVIHRHGDRCPTEPALNTASEVDYWLAQLPTDVTAMEVLDASFGRRDVMEKESDVPWGRLTRRGMAQTRARGEQIRNALLNACGCGDAAADAVLVRNTVKRAEVCSSRYERVQRSVQSLLNGLVGDAAVARDAAAMEPLVSITSSSDDSAAINPWDSDAVMQERVFAAARLEAFVVGEASAAADRAALCDALPLFGGGDCAETREVRAERRATFLWIRAADVFWTRDAHALALPLEAAIAARTIAHTLWRFNSWYKDDAILGRAAAPLLERICGQFERARARGDDHADAPALAVYSGHDVTVLPVLHALGVCATKWPGYASAITLELWQHECDGMQPAWRVRVLYADGHGPDGAEAKHLRTLELDELSVATRALRLAAFP